MRTTLVILALSVPFFLLTIWAIVSAAQREFASMGHKALWIIIASIPFIGFIPYFLIGFRLSKKPEDAAPS